MSPFVDGNESDRGDGYGQYVRKMAQPGEESVPESMSGEGQGDIAMDEPDITPTIPS